MRRNLPRHGLPDSVQRVKFRMRDDLTQAELAKKTGMLQSHISEMEKGTRPIGKIVAKKFAQVFNTDYKLFL